MVRKLKVESQKFDKNVKWFTLHDFKKRAIYQGYDFDILTLF